MAKNIELELRAEVPEESFIKILNKLKKDGKLISKAKAGNISYIEIEKMTTERRQKEDKNELIRLAKNLKIDLFKNRKEFIDLCHRLTATCDWRFNGSSDDYKKLERLLGKY